MEKHEVISAIACLTNLLNSWVVTDEKDLKDEIVAKIRQLITLI